MTDEIKRIKIETSEEFHSLIGNFCSLQKKKKKLHRKVNVHLEKLEPQAL